MTDSNARSRPQSSTTQPAGLRVAFLLPHGGGALGLTSEPFGGGETGPITLARGIASQGHAVDVVIESATAVPGPRRDGLRVVVAPTRLRTLARNLDREVTLSRRFPFVRPVRPTWRTPPKLVALAATYPLRRFARSLPDWLATHPADVWVAHGVNRESAALVAACGERTVVQLIADQDVAAGWNDPAFVSTYGEPAAACRPLFDQAAAFIAQTPRQAERLRANFGHEATVIPGPLGDEWFAGGHAPPADLPKRYALWIGRADRFHKRPTLMLEIAQQCPAIPIVMIMNRQDEAVDAEIRAAAPTNVTFIERVPYDRMPSVFAGAAAFVTTGAADQEGMPNVLLQASAIGVPIVSLEAGAEYLAASRGGVVCGSTDQAAASLQGIWDRAIPDAIDLRYAKHYVEQTYRLQRVVARHLEVFAAVARGDATA